MQAKAALSVTGKEDLAPTDVVQEDIFLSCYGPICNANVPLWLQNACFILWVLILLSIRGKHLLYCYFLIW